MTAFNSDAIYVFPCARKGGSSLASEYNFTHLSGRVSNKTSYVIGTVNNILQVVLDGYYFEIKDEDIESLCTKKLILWLETLPETDSTGGWAHVTRRVCGVKYDTSENKWKKLQDLDNGDQFSALYPVEADDPSDPSNSSNEISIETGLTYVCLDLNDETNRVDNIHKSIEDKLTLGTYANGREYATVKDYVEAAIAALKIGDYAKAANLTALANRVAALEAKPFNTYATKSEVDAKFADYSTTAQINKAIEDAVEGTITGAELGIYAKKSDLEDIYKAGVDGGEATGVLAAEIARAKAAEEANANAISAIVGEDSGKTIRAIAVEETAAIVAGADAKYDTLKKIADFIVDDKTGAAAMSNDIAALKTAVGNDESGLVRAVTEVDNKFANYTTTEILEATYVTKKELPDTIKSLIPGSINIYAVAFDANGGVGIMTPVICISGSYSLPEPSFTPPDNQSFKAWGLKTGDDTITPIEGNEITITGNTILYAMWAEDNPET